jgi:hypothetical protein
MRQTALTCKSEQRRERVRGSTFFGLDYLEVSPDQLMLTVYFLGRAPQEIVPANLQISGGERITNIQVTGVTLQPADDPTLDDAMLVAVNQPGDFSTYCLCARALDDQGRPTAAPMAGFDPRYACVQFSFKAGCPSDFDCAAPLVCPPPQRTEPDINYLAKDYASFRQLILDRLAVIMPNWQETHAPDIGIALVEILAYVGDYLSYFQDAVATEAYLGTARQRISVRRHARLIDYAMHEGCNARAWGCLSLQPAGSSFAITPSDTVFISGLDQIPSLASKSILAWSDLTGIPPNTYEIFEPLVADATAKIPLYAAHNEISFYTWGDKQCCLPIGATKAVLLDAWATPAPAPPSTAAPADVAPPARQLQLAAGDVLIFEEVKGPITGNPDDADPSRRWPVRLTQVTPIEDPLIKTADGRPTPLLAIEWSAADALPAAFCLSARLPAPDCRIICDISVACGNVILVDHGQTLRPCEDLGVVEKIDETGCCACEGSVIEMTSVPGIFKPVLKQSPLTFRCALKPSLPASKMLTQNPREASPAITLNSIPPAPDGTTPLFVPADLQDDTALAGALKLRANPTAEFLFSSLSATTKAALNQWNGTNPPPSALLAALASDLKELLETWLPQRDLLESGPGDSQFVVEMDDNGLAHLRFGDGVCGRQPEAGMEFLACYRIGNGTAGNVGAEHISKIAFRTNTVEGISISVRNPLPAQGGTDPEPVAEVKLFAPGAFKKVIERAITAADYAAIAERNPKLQQANADLRWTGSWYEAQVAVDPLGTELPDESLLRNVRAHLNHFRRLGHDLAVNAAEYVPLQLAMDICVLPQYQRGHVEAALLDVFSNRVLASGQLGFFNPDNLTFGEGIYLSQIVAAAQAVTGVQSVSMTVFQRLFAPAGSELTSGVLKLAPNEIAQLDNDLNFPEHGTLTLNLRGGR